LAIVAGKGVSGKMRFRVRRFKRDVSITRFKKSFESAW
jgi:hypothetical protein